MAAKQCSSPFFPTLFFQNILFKKLRFANRLGICTGLEMVLLLELAVSSLGMEWDGRWERQRLFSSLPFIGFGVTFLVLVLVLHTNNTKASSIPQNLFLLVRSALRNIW